MIQKTQNLFHTDKWWGKVVFSLLLYFMYWIIFYGILFFIFGSMSEYEIGGKLFLLYIIVIIPVSSLIIPSIIKKYFI